MYALQLSKVILLAKKYLGIRALSKAKHCTVVSACSLVVQYRKGKGLDNANL